MGRKHAAHLTLVDKSDQADGTVVREVISFLAYKAMSLHIKTYGGTADDTVSVDIFYSNNDDADADADTNWISASASIFGGTITTTNTTDEAMHFVTADLHPAKKYMVKVSFAYGGGGSPDNSAQIYLTKSPIEG